MQAIDPTLAMLAMLVGALLLDRFVGEYPAAIHPVVWIGKLTSGLLHLGSPCTRWWPQFIFGIFLAMVVISVSVAAAIRLLQVTSFAPWLSIVAGTFLLKASFALRELGAAAERVRTPIA